MANSLANLTDAELYAVATQIYNTISPTPTDWGMTAGEVTALGASRDTFNDDLVDLTSLRAAAKAATVKKETDRTDLITLLRQFRDKAKAKGVSDDLMTSTGMPKGSNQPTPPSATVPVATVDTSRRLQHTVHWAEATTPDNKKRPKGVMGADIYCKIDGPPPGDVSECNFVTTDSATPYLIEYAAEQAGKMAHYMLRWRYRDGGVGAWGETVSATVTG